MTFLMQFRDALLSASESDIEKDPGLGGRLRLHQEGKFTIDYAPFEYVEANARIVIVGITPGSQQASNALKRARQSLLDKHDEFEAIKSAKVFASFSGPMRSNLIAMLDHIGIQRLLGINSTAALWAEKSKLVHFTSALRNPVYFNGKNYSGTPSMTRVPALTQMLEIFLGQEAKELSKAIWIPLGPAASAGVEWIVKKGFLGRGQILLGLPHPSPLNGERIAYFLQRKAREKLSSKTSSEKIDIARTNILSQIASMAAVQ